MIASSEVAIKVWVQVKGMVREKEREVSCQWLVANIETGVSHLRLRVMAFVHAIHSIVLFARISIRFDWKGIEIE